MGLFIKSKERKKREIEERKKEVIRSIMPERHYNMLEAVVEHWNRTIRGIDTQMLGEKLRGEEGMQYLHVKEDVKKDIQYLHTRGYVFCNKENFVFPTRRGTTVYRMVHPDALISANCEIRDSYA